MTKLTHLDKEGRAKMVDVTGKILTVRTDIAFDNKKNRIDIEACVKVTGQTGVEMEALAAVSVAALTIYDMCKAVDKEMVISDIMLIEKRGGGRGNFKRKSTPSVDCRPP